MRIRPKFLTAVALIATVAGFAVPAVPASAAGSAFNQRRQYLAYDAAVGSLEYCVQRKIYIAANDYLWTEFVDHISEWKSRTIYLRSDTYTWTTCIKVVGKYAYNVARYRETTTLQGSVPGAASISADNYLGGDSSHSREYTFGSELIPLN
jgi:hypothetical protein